MQTSALSSVLGDSWFGATLPVASRASLAGVARLVEVPDGAVLSEEGRPGLALGVVIQGRVAVRLHVRGGGDRTIAMVEPGEAFGWSVVLPGMRATATCVATAPSVVVLFETVGLQVALDADPLLAAAVYRQLLVAAATRLMATRRQLFEAYRVPVDRT